RPPPGARDRRPARPRGERRGRDGGRVHHPRRRAGPRRRLPAARRPVRRPRLRPRRPARRRTAHRVTPTGGLLGLLLGVGLLLAGKRRADLREVWPEVVDNLASAVRAGLSLPEALAALATRGPEVLRPPFARFAADHRSSGRFGPCLDRLKVDLADPVGDRIV